MDMPGTIGVKNLDESGLEIHHEILDYCISLIKKKQGLSDNSLIIIRLFNLYLVIFYCSMKYQ